MRTRVSLILVTATAIAVLTALALPASAVIAPHQATASTASNAAIAIARKVLDADNPTAAWNDLTPAQKRAYGIATRPVSVTVEVTDVHRIGGKTDVIPRNVFNGCHSAYEHLDWNGIFGTTTYTTWLGIKWCEKNAKITSFSEYTMGGETRTPGWDYLGIIGHGGRKTSSEVRYYAEAKFGYGIGVDITYSDACTQVDGYNDSSYGYQKSCNIG